MTPSPLPPPGPADGTNLNIYTVMTGQILEDLGTGAQTVAPMDLVVLAAIKDGRQVAAYQMGPAEAMEVARALSSAAGRIVNAQIDDNGKPLPLPARLRLLTGGNS